MQLSGLRSRDTVSAWIPFSNSLQWLFSASATLYVLDYPYCDYWYNFILCNSWVIILLKIYKPAFLLIKYPCSIRAWVPMSFFLPFFLSLSLSLPPSSSLFHFLIVDSRPPGSGPLKDPNTEPPEKPYKNTFDAQTTCLLLQTSL